MLCSYDDLPYEGRVCWYSHPDRLAALATLYGMHPPAVDRCRVLEIGCGPGLNVIAIAQDLAGSHCVGIDLSPRQIASGQEVVDALGLPNVELRAADLLAVEDLDTFDYILCHGVYSWVPPPVQDKILAICARHLAQEGVAYVSYNTYPGWHLRGVIRELMLFHVNQFPEPRKRVRQARALLDFLKESAATSDRTYVRLLREEAAMLKERSDSYVYHEHLEAANHPVYFHEFAAHAAAHGLQYLSEAHFLPLPVTPSAQALKTLEQMPDRLRQEQYLDFVGNRTFRWTLLCHAAVKLQPGPAPKGVRTMYASGLVRPQSAQPDVCSTAALEFRIESSGSLKTGIPLVKAMLVTLFEAQPRALPFATLWAGVSAHLTQNPAFLEKGRASLANYLLQCVLTGTVELQVREPSIQTAVSPRPIASPLARFLAAEDQPVPNLRHRNVQLIEPVRLVLRHLDGSRDADALVEEMTGQVLSGQLDLQHEGQPVRDPEKVRHACRAALGHILPALAKNAFLVS